MNYELAENIHTVLSSIAQTFHNGLMYILDLIMKLGSIEGSQQLIDILNNIMDDIIHTTRLFVRIIRRLEAHMTEGNMPNVRIFPILAFIEIGNLANRIILDRAGDRLRR
jgi:hypothetical protein